MTRIRWLAECTAILTALLLLELYALITCDNDVP